jgi:hypothetical protein
MSVPTTNETNSGGDAAGNGTLTPGKLQGPTVLGKLAALRATILAAGIHAAFRVLLLMRRWNY